MLVWEDPERDMFEALKCRKVPDEDDVELSRSELTMGNSELLLTRRTRLYN